MPLFNPVAQPELVSEYDIRTASGNVIGIASAVQSSGSSGNGLLPLGALMPAGAPEDVYVTALSGGNLLGMARIKDVTIKAGKKSTYEAPLRKPLVFVGSTLPAGDGRGQQDDGRCRSSIRCRRVDLAQQPARRRSSLAGMTAGASTLGRALRRRRATAAR